MLRKKDKNANAPPPGFNRQMQDPRMVPRIININIYSTRYW